MTDIKSIVDKQSRHISFINATAFYVLAFIIIYFLNLLVVFGLASYFGIDAKFLYYKVDYLISNSSERWTTDALILMFMAGPFISLLVAGIFARLHTVFRADKGHLKLFFLYMYMHGMNFCFASFIAGSISNDYTWFAMAWLNIPQLMMYVIGIVGLALLLVVGSAKSIFLMEASNYARPNHPINRQYWLLNTALKPWFVGSIIIILVLLPEIDMYYIIILISYGIMNIPIFRNSSTTPEVMSFDAATSFGVFWKVWIAFFAIISFMRLFLV